MNMKLFRTMNRIRLLAAFQVLEMAWKYDTRKAHGVSAEQAAEVIRELTGIYLGDYGMKRPLKGPSLENYFDSLGYDTPEWCTR